MIGVTEITLVSASACHLCRDAREGLDELAREFPVEVREVDIASTEGRRIVERFRPPMPPAVLVNGVLFSFGRLPRKKLRRQLEQAA
jgi:thiol-disulfide isomerase/thioredoxin